jgi:nucleoside-diphosphate-sugar epimerase
LENTMTGTVLILGANGRFGRAATHAFAQGGWDVRAATRNGQGASDTRITRIACDVMDRQAVMAAASGADVIVHAVNPPYPDWSRVMPVHTANIIAAGLASGATVMIPANVYTFGANAEEILQEAAIPAPTTRKGALRVTMERAFEAATAQGLQTILLRGGDYLERTKTGNWFDSHIANKANKGVFTYPGAMNAVHAWAYLPDMARAMAELAAVRAKLPAFAPFGFAGYSLTGAQLQDAVAQAVGHPMKTRRFPWTVLRVISPFNPLIREVLEMRYLWDTPHRIDGSALRAALPDFTETPLAVAMAEMMAQDTRVGILPHRITPRSA